MKLLGFSASLIDRQAIKDAGYDVVIGYFSDSRPGADVGAKPLRRDYCDRLRAVGDVKAICAATGSVRRWGAITAAAANQSPTQAAGADIRWRRARVRSARRTSAGAPPGPSRCRRTRTRGDRRRADHRVYIPDTAGAVSRRAAC